MSETVSIAKLPRDVRLDRIGFVKELGDKFADPLKEKVKGDLLAERIQRASGDYFEGLVVSGVIIQTVDPDKYLRLYERGKITRPQLLAAIKVGRDAALDSLGRDALAAISTEKASPAALRISRIKGVDLRLVDAVKEIAAAIG